MEQEVSVSGIKQKADGTREVPASQRADGTIRATIRIRPGFVPAADKPKYKPPRSRAPTRMDETVSDKLDSLSLTEFTSQPQAKGVEAKAKDPSIKIESRTLNKANDGTAVESKTVRPVEATSTPTASESLLAWSNAAWKGMDDTPSRYATAKPLPASSPSVPTDQIQNTKSTNTSKTSRHKPKPVRKITSHKTESSTVEEKVLGLETELRKVNLSTSAVRK